MASKAPPTGVRKSGPRQTGRERQTLHEGFLRHANFRWAKISGGICLVLTVAYLLIDIQPRPNGGSWYGYTLGTIGLGLILWLTALGFRKRQMTEGRWSLKAWTSAHVYLGLGLIVIGTLHTGFQFGWNVHTLAYALMMLVILSGIFGIAVYAGLPAALSNNREEMTQMQMLEGVRSLDRQLHDAAQPLPHDVATWVLESLKQNPFGGGLIRRLSGRYPNCATAKTHARIRSMTMHLAQGEEGPLVRIDALLDRKEALLWRLRRHLRLKALLEVWLYVHVPATFALIASLVAHVVSVFFYGERADMTFLIRQISRTATGREIVRERRIEKPLIVVGRAAESDIALQDLAVEPSHARLALVGDRQLKVGALGTLGFTLDGKTVTDADIDIAQGGELRFGAHLLTIGQDTDTGAVTIAVQRVEAVSDASEEKDEVEVFTLKGSTWSKRTMAWSLVVAVLIGFLALPIMAYVGQGSSDTRSIYGFKPDKSWSSGALSQAHHSLENKCESCHVKAFVSVQDTACVACHKTVHDHAPAELEQMAMGGKSLGSKFLSAVGQMFGKPAYGCVDCHTEHEGAGRMPQTPQVFCSDCHATLKERVPQTKLADAADFTTAHPEFRPVVSVVPGAHPKFQRALLSSKPQDNSGLKFPHDLHLSRTGGVARMAQTMRGQYGFGDAMECKDCHRPTADGVRFLPVEMERDCAMCHSLAFDKQGGTFRTLRHGDPRQVIADLRALYAAGGPAVEYPGGMRTRPGAYASSRPYAMPTFRPVGADAVIRGVFSPGGACYDCHTITPPGVRGATEWTVLPVNLPVRFMMKGWFDHDAHKQEKCESCHAASRSNNANQLMLPDLASCRECHGGESSKADVPSSCALCHSYHARPGAPWVSALRVVRSKTGTEMTKARQGNTGGP